MPALFALFALFVQTGNETRPIETPPAILRVSLHAEPDTPRTDALLAALRERFSEVVLGSATAKVHVFDRWDDARDHASPWWLPYDGLDARWNTEPCVFLGATVERATRAFGLVAGEWTTPVEGPLLDHGHPVSASASLSLTQAQRAALRLPTAFAIAEAPDAELVLTTTDAFGRPVAAAWQQHGYLFLPALAGTAVLDEEQRALFLAAVDLASTFDGRRGLPLSRSASGESAAGELRWWLSTAATDLARCRELLVGAPSGADVSALRAWHDEHGAYLVPDHEGRLGIDADLAASGRPSGDPRFVESALAELSAPALEVRERARRLLARHVDGGPGRYASAASWRAWFAEYGAHVVYCPSDQRWRVDYVARANGWAPGRRPRERGTARLELAHAPEGVEGDALVDWLLTINARRPDGVPLLSHELVERVQGALTARLSRARSSADSTPEEREALLAWIDRLPRPDAAVIDAVLAHNRAFPESATRPLTILSRANQVDVEALIEVVSNLAVHAEHTPEFVAWHQNEFRGATIARAVSAARDPVAATVRLADAALAHSRDGRPVVADMLVHALSRCDATLDVDADRVLDLLATREAIERGAASPRASARLIGRRGDPRRMPAVDALVERVSANPSAHDLYYVTPALFSLGDAGLSRFVELLSSARNHTHTWLCRQLANWPGLTDERLRTWIAGESQRPLAYATLALATSTHAHWLPDLRATALGDDEGEAVLAVATLGHWAEGRDDIAPILGEALEHRSVWVRRMAAFELGSPYRDVRGATKALVNALDDRDEWVRVLATWALREPAGAGEDVATRALRRVAEGDGATARVARDALERRSPDPAWRVAALRRAASWIPSDTGGGDLDHEDGPARWKAARDIARSEAGAALLAAHGDPGAAARSAEEERLRRIDHEFGEWLAHLCDVLDEEFMGGPATNELSELGALAVPSLERELMRPYRFPIGSDATYMELVICLGRIGRDAWPVLAASHWHWRGHGFTDATPAWQTVAPENADILVPMTAMRLVHDAALGTTFESFAHLASDRDVETHLRPIWRALGPTGKAARGELAAHPLCSVRDAARRVEP